MLPDFQFGSGIKEEKLDDARRWMSCEGRRDMEA